MLLARMPAKDGAVFGIPDAEYLVGEAKPPGRADGSGEREILCSPADRKEPLRQSPGRHRKA